MAPKKRRAASAEQQQEEERSENDAPPAEQEPRQRQRRGGAGAAAAAGAPPINRAQQAADIARRRAAHFARFEDGGAEGEEHGDDGNVHVGGDQARNLGPWSSAVELVNARQQAAAARSEKIMDAARKAVGQQEEVSWEASRDPALGPRVPKSRVPPLLDLSLQLLVKHIEDVVSLWGVPDAIKCQLAAAVCARRALSPAAAQLFAEHAPCEVALPNCTQLDQEGMIQLLTTACSARLERLDLGCCGRGFTDASARALAAAAGDAGLPALASLALQGAYNFTDAALFELLAAAPALRRLAVPQGSKFGGGFVERLPALLPRLEELDLSECRGVPGAALSAALPQLMALRRVALDGIPEVDDSVIAAVGKLPSLTALSLAFCQSVSDAALASLGSGAPNLAVLVIDDCARVGDPGLIALAAGCRRLARLSARRCVKLTDAGLVAVAERCPLRRLEAAGVPGVGAPTASALARCCGGSLEFLDLSFCRGVPEAALGLLADRCPKLSELRVYGCTQVTDRLVNGTSNEVLAFKGLATSVRTVV
ncbi:hypothetical protein Rsub_03998 [Raphidocelis subcapitata]|uniref:F-box/LRR-repeat protein 15-like leucin rich repeat domain-containing protein n=1 Tax=Raphidocelis subcapitata TaxID=307507 RepID=A0A2V0NVM3_9CHLO|nr:hypothetical protein Rsub_03998 [Raphidocelis subcapitata]|eukprot:GBF91694.1 hypothetical protein Rsub_03998 [Raphidocelis subcapitata]